MLLHRLNATFARFASLLFLSFALHVGAEEALDPNNPEWELQKDQDDIQVYFKTVTGSDIKAFMGKTVMSASLSSIIKVLQADESCKDWVEGCVEARTLEGGRFDEFFQYGINHLPWPADNRDYVTRISTREKPETGEVMVSLDAVEGHIPLADSVRITNMTIRYLLSPLSERETAVTWVQHTEPGGYIPDWLVNMLLIDIPFYSLTRLEQVANQPGYRGAEFVYDNNQRIIDVK